MNYKRVEDVLLDDGFYAWYLHTNEQLVHQWNEWRIASEENRVLLEESVRVVRSLIAMQDENGFPKRIHAVHSRINRAIAESNRKMIALPVVPNKAAIPDTELFDYSLS